MKLSLRKGRTKWVDQHEARMLQREGQVICVLAIRNEEHAEFPPLGGIKKEYRHSCVLSSNLVTDRGREVWGVGCGVAEELPRLF